MMFVFFIIFYFLNIKFKRKKIEYLFIIFMISSSLLSVYVSITHTPNFSEYTQLEKEVVSLFPYIEGRYIMVHNDNVSSYDRAYYSYGAIYYNLSSAGGWYKILTNQDYLLKYSKTISSYRENNCKEFIKNLDNLNVNEVLFYGYECNKLNKCELIEKKSLERACLYKRV
jgi:hypothetical protein